MNHPSVFLVGLPGAGKTHWGRLWAEAWGWNFADLDDYIEYREQRRIAAIFEQSGEAVFRQRERDALQELIRLHPYQAVIACGGGTPAYFDNLSIMKTAGCVVYLRTTTARALHHLQQDMIVRPLLQQGEPERQLELLLQQRRIFYEQAHFSVSAEKLTAATFAEILDSCTNRH